MRKKKAQERAKELFSQQEQMVPLAQHQLFNQFESIIEGTSSSIENWIKLVEIAQQAHRNNLEQEKRDLTLFQFSFTTSTNHTNSSNNQRSYQGQNTTQLFSRSSLSQNRSKWVQQDLRQLSLRPNLNIRKK